MAFITGGIKDHSSACCGMSNMIRNKVMSECQCVLCVIVEVGNWQTGATLDTLQQNWQSFVQLF